VSHTLQGCSGVCVRGRWKNWRSDSNLKWVDGFVRTPTSAGISNRIDYTGFRQDQAFTWLDKAFVDHDPFLVYIKADPNFDVIAATLDLSRCPEDELSV
jgi:hypothetical protein